MLKTKYCIIPNGIERRAEERDFRIVPIRYCYSFLADGEVVPFQSTGMTLDVSASGLSFRTTTPIEHMMSIELSSDHLWLDGRNGVVKWCSKIYGDLYRVGVAFI